jgi:hypothetical protein
MPVIAFAAPTGSVSRIGCILSHQEMKTTLTDVLTTFFTAIIAVTGIWAAFYARQQINDFHEESRIQHLLTLQQQYEQEPMVTYRKVCAKKRLAHVEDPPEEEQMLNFFETVALLANEGYLTDKDVWETFGSEIFPLYADDRDSIEQDRKEDPAEYSNLVLLVPRLEAIDVAQHGTEYKLSKEDIEGYWEDEANVGVGTPTGHHKTPHQAPKK